jgi:hypothetical protein
MVSIKDAEKKVVAEAEAEILDARGKAAQIVADLASDARKEVEARVAAERRKLRLPRNRIGLSAHFRGDTLCARVPDGWSKDDVLAASTTLSLPHVAVGTQIEFMDDSATWYLLAVVQTADIGREHYRLAELFSRELPVIEDAEPFSSYGFTAFASGLHEGPYSIRRDRDGVIVRRQLPDRSTAIEILQREFGAGLDSSSKVVGR